MFVSWISVPRAHEYSLGAVTNFFENSRKYSWMNVYRRYQRHRRLILVTDFQWSPASLTPAIHLWPVTTTTVINLLPVTTTSVIRVYGVSMDASFHGGSNETIVRRVWLRRPEISPFWFEIVLAASGASNQGVWGVFGCVLVVPMTPSAAASDPGGRRYCCLIVSIVLSQIVPRCRWYRTERTKKPKIYRKCQRLIAGVNDIAEKLFTGVSMTPLINFSPMSVLTIPACQGLKMKTKQKFNLQV